jgi:hypothetical protein
LTTQEQQIQSTTSHPANTSSPPTSTTLAACSATNASTPARAEASRRDLGSLSREELPWAPARYTFLFLYSLGLCAILTGLVFPFSSIFLSSRQPRAPSEAAATAYAVTRSERSVMPYSALYPPPFDLGQIQYEFPLFPFTSARSAFIPLSIPSFSLFSYPPRVYPSLQSSRYPRDLVPVAGDSKFFSREEDPGTCKSGARASPEAQSDPTPTPAQGPSRLRGGPPPPPARQVGAIQAVSRVTTTTAAPSVVHPTRKRKRCPSKHDDISDDDNDFASAQPALPLRPDQHIMCSIQARIRRIARQRALHLHRRSVRAWSDRGKRGMSKYDDLSSRLGQRVECSLPQLEQRGRRVQFRKILRMARVATSQVFPLRRSRVGNASDSRLLGTISSKRRQPSGQVYKGRPSSQDDFPDGDDDFAPASASTTASSPAAPSAAPIPTRVTSPLCPAPCVTTQSASLPKLRSGRERKRRSSKHGDFSRHQPDYSAIWCNNKAPSVALDGGTSTAGRQIQAELRSHHALRPRTWTASTGFSDACDSAAAGREAPADSTHRRHRVICSGTSGDEQDPRFEGIARLSATSFNLARACSLKRTDLCDNSDSRRPTSPARGESQRANDRSRAEWIARYRLGTTQAAPRITHLSVRARVSVEHTHKRRSDQDQSDIAELGARTRQRDRADHSKQLGLQRGGTTPAIGRRSSAPDSTRQVKRKTADEIATEADWGQSVAQ